MDPNQPTKPGQPVNQSGMGPQVPADPANQWNPPAAPTMPGNTPPDVPMTPPSRTQTPEESVPPAPGSAPTLADTPSMPPAEPGEEEQTGGPMAPQTPPVASGV